MLNLFCSKIFFSLTTGLNGSVRSIIPAYSQQSSQDKKGRAAEIHQTISNELAAKEKEREQMARMLEELYAEQREQQICREIAASEAKIAAMKQQMIEENRESLLRKQQRMEKDRI